jgi:hypothetical protein
MDGTIGELEGDPYRRHVSTRDATGANWTKIAKRANRNENGVNDYKPQRQVIADKPTNESRWGKYFEEPRYVLLHGVCRLSDHQEKK